MRKMPKTIVRQHKRRTPKGKITIVRKHTRSVSEEKIKGWKKIKNESLDMRWRNMSIASSHKGKREVRVVKYGEWIVDIDFPPKPIKTFKTKKEALSYAIKFMRTHPNG